jgi:hypothetical protein
MKAHTELYENCPECDCNNWKQNLLKNYVKCNNCGNKYDNKEVNKLANGSIESVGETLNSEFIRSDKANSQRENIDFNDDLKQQIDDKKIEGWKILEGEPDRAVMGKPKSGGVLEHAVVFLFFGWWTLGFANVIYHEYRKKKTVDTLVLRSDQ